MVLSLSFTLVPSSGYRHDYILTNKTRLDGPAEDSTSRGTGANGYA